MSARLSARAAALALPLALALATPAALHAQGPLGSGTVSFNFTGFRGPSRVYQDPNDPNTFITNGLVNGVAPTQTGQLVPTGSVFLPNAAYGMGQQALSGSSVSLLYDFFSPGSPFENVISFLPAPFTNVPQGQNVTLGRLTFKNGGWFGAGPSAAFNVPTFLDFTITTNSATPAFSQTFNGTLVMAVHSPTSADCSTPAGQDAEADWLYITGPGIIGGPTTNSLRVYDNGCLPAGFTTTGSADLVAQFNSLDLVGFQNASGGFIAPSTDPITPEVVPEPATVVLTASGLLMVGVAARRRRTRG